jgi:predicted phosphodiesterase
MSSIAARSDLRDCPRIAVISDVHANAPALTGALGLVERHGFDQLVILGDLLTYGCRPVEVIELAADAISKHGAVVVTGNHDQLYFDLRCDQRDYYEQMPSWIRESVDWTLEHRAIDDLAEMLPWRDSFECGGVFFAHANPFPYGDWTYLNNASDFLAASRSLAARGSRVGTFGHTHRCKLATVNADSTVDLHDSPIPLTWEVIGSVRSIVLNAGSVGQPRDQLKAANVLVMSGTSAGLNAEFLRVDYDLGAHLEAIARSGMSPQTVARLASFFLNGSRG